jgi:hypothetical protein
MSHNGDEALVSTPHKTATAHELISTRAISFSASSAHPLYLVDDTLPSHDDTLVGSDPSICGADVANRNRFCARVDQ